MSANSFGEAFKIVTFGESHGPYIGVVIDGLQPGIPLSIPEIQHELDRRRPGQSKLTTQRREEDRVEVVSGVFEGKTTGAPLCMLIKNKDQRSQDYRQLKDLFRPGHAGFTFLKKYGIYDYRGGGRASGRETAARVAAGAAAKQLLDRYGISVAGFTRQVGPIRGETVDFDVIEKNPVRAADLQRAGEMAAYIQQVAKEGDSVGGIVEIQVHNCPIGLGEPVFHKLEADFAAALMSIGAVKGFEIGDGFAAARMKGSEHNDELVPDPSNKTARPNSNHAGGVLGGVSNGAPLVMRIAVKPTSSIAKTQKTVTTSGETVQFKTTGRHDPCICPRIVPVAEAMVRLVLIDHLLLQERIAPGQLSASPQNSIHTIDTHLLLLLAQRKKLLEAQPSDEAAAPPAGEENRNLWQSVAKQIDLDRHAAESLYAQVMRLTDPKYSK